MKQYAASPPISAPRINPKINPKVVSFLFSIDASGKVTAVSSGKQERDGRPVALLITYI